jgi:hypothetical protein
MSDTTDADGGSVPDAPPEPEQTPTLRRAPKRQGRRLIVVVVFIVVVAGAALWWRQTATSDPRLRFTRFNHVVRVEHDATGNQEGVVRTENALGTQVDIAFVPKQRIFVYLALRNDGSQAVRIDQVPATGFYYFGFDTMEVSPDPDAGPGQVTTFEPFKPFTLNSGEERSVRLNVRLADCTASGLQPGTTRIRGLLVRYEILGLGRTGFAPFDQSVLAVPTIGRCEHPIIDPTGGPVPD